jgi:E3 ubiquitin-protein ligase HUWE1
MATFLTSYLSNTMLKTYFVDHGGIELLLDICESPSLPATFGDSMASRVLNSLISQLVEYSPIRGLPSLLKRAQVAIGVLKPLASKEEAVPPYFAPFLTAGPPAGKSEEELSELASAGTAMVKALLNAQTFIKIISDCFPTSRSNNLQFYPVNVYDYYLDLVKSISPLLRGVLAEEAGELTVVPSHWSLRRHQPLPEGNSGTESNEAEVDAASIPDVINSTGAWDSNAEGATRTSGRPTEQEQSTARFQNYETLRILLHPLIPTTFPLFQTLGKALLPRREPNHGDPYYRSRHLEIARALADSVLSHLRPSVAIAEPTSKDFHYWIIMLHTIHEMLIDHREIPLYKFIGFNTDLDS